MVRRLFPLALLVLLVVAACSPEPTEIEIPTLVLIPTISPDQAETATAVAYATSLAPPTLPPTWTPIPRPTIAPPTETGQPVFQLPPEVRGRFVFLADGAVQVVEADGGVQTALTRSIEAHDLALSPDQQTLAFAAQATDSTEELFIIDLTTGVARQVTRQGYAAVIDPSWHPDGDRLVYAAAMTVGGARNVYLVRPTGADLQQVTTLAAVDPAATPTGNEDGLVLPGQLVSDPIFTPDGEGVLFAAPSLVMLDLASGTVAVMTISSGVGNDHSPRWRPGSTELVYIRPASQDSLSGPLHAFDLNTHARESVPPEISTMPAQAFVFSADGRYMAFTNGFSIYVRDFSLRSTREVATTGDVPPLVAINRAGTHLAYVGGGPGDPATPHLWIMGRSGINPQALTAFEGNIFGDLLWVEVE